MSKAKNKTMDRPRDAHGRFESADQAQKQNMTKTQGKQRSARTTSKK